MFSRFLVAAVALLSAGAAHAHEIGTSRVAVLFRQGHTYQVEIVTDATALAEKLQSVAGDSSPVPSRAADLESLIARSEDMFRRRIKLTFDGVPVSPAITYAVAPPIDATSAAAATIRLTGEIPSGAQQF